MKPTRRAQAALEFLSTYGWMILVLAVVGSALAYFGVFDNESMLPPRCDFGLSFGCERSALHENGEVRATLLNNVGEPIDVISYTCTFEGNTVKETPSISDWMPGTSKELVCTVGTLPAGDYSSVQVVLEYRPKEDFSKSAKGVIAGNVA